MMLVEFVQERVNYSERRECQAISLLTHSDRLSKYSQMCSWWPGRPFKTPLSQIISPAT